MTEKPIDILKKVRSIAIVGISKNVEKDSYVVMQFLLENGYDVFPVNPNYKNELILGRKCSAYLKDIDENIDMVDIFRNSEAAGQITDDAIKAGAKIVWMQLGVRNDEAAKRAEDAGLRVVMNRCPKIEYARLYGELSWHGINSHVITSKRRRLA